MRKNYLIILLLFLVSFPAAAQVKWEVIGNMQRPVSGAQAVVLNNKIYVIGGYSSIDQKTVNWIQEFDPNTYTWKQVGEMKANRKGFYVAKSLASIFFIGGIEESSPYIYNLEFWNPSNPSNTLLTGNENNFNRIFATGNYSDNKLYLFGGFSSPNVSDSTTLSYFIEYDLQNNRVLTDSNFNYVSNDFPNQQMSAIVENNIYIFGGTLNGLLKSIHEYNTVTNEFVEFGSELSSPRAGGAAVKDENSNNVYLIGGFDEGNAALSVVEVFNPINESNNIQSASSLVNKRTNPAAVFYEGSIYVFGGQDVGGNVVKEIEKLELYPVTTGIESESLPHSISLNQNYPNPFNPTTVIGYEITERSYISLKVFDILGNEVIELVNGFKQPGHHEVQFNADELTSGIYFYRLKSGNILKTKKMVVIK